jgi:PEP-CTERM/exosortase A-associated glycosyltransferase
MKILHILDHSIPLHSGYTFRTRAILEQQRALGWETAHLTSIKHIAPQARGEASSEAQEPTLRTPRSGGERGRGPGRKPNTATAPATALGPSELINGLRFYRTPAIANPFARLPVLNQWEVVRSLERRLPQVIAAERPDILHAHSPGLNGVAAVRVGARLGLPAVYECRAFWEDAAADHGTSTNRGPRYRLTRGLETWVFRHADAVTCICEGLRSDIVARGIPPSKVTVIPNAVDMERFAYNRPRDTALANELGLSEATVFGFLGSFYAYEGLTLAVQALPAILKSHPNARLLLVGGGPQEAMLKDMTRALGLSDKVLFAGRVPHDDVARYYSLVDVLIYPRMPMRLTELVTPLKPLEAMAQGKLVLASDVGGHRELIRNRENGRLFKAGSADALAEAVIQLMGDREAWEPQRHAGRRYVEQERNWPTSVARYRPVYEGLLGAGAAGPVTT